MKHSLRSILTLCVIVLWAGLALWAWLKPADEISEAERRKLATMPTLSGESILSGQFTSKFETYATDQFPLRDSFRTLKAVFHYRVLGQRDNNGIFLADDTAAKLEYPLNAASVDHALSVFGKIYDRYLAESECQIYQAIIPDKGYYLSDHHQLPTLDYDALCAHMAEGMPWANAIRLEDCLCADDYYRTDTHWRQERLFSAAARLCDGLQIPAPRPEDYTQRQISDSFYGVYYGQAALPMPPDALTVLDSDLLSQCTVYNYENQKTTAIYDMDKLSSRDLYDIYLSGAAALLRIDNPNANTDRELVVFRDSFGSSMVPLLTQGYRTVTVVDLRYVRSDLLGSYLTLDDQDVLFLYSTLVLNNSNSLK